MSHKSGKVSTLIAGLRSHKYDPRYLGYFECFNRKRFYEAHEVLEELWLASKDTPNRRYYQGLIMAAGAFVHFQKNRPKGASNLLRTAIDRLKPFGAVHEGFEVGKFVESLESWLYLVDSMGHKENPFDPRLAPKIELLDA
jgi:predicted metal-dependent hydrolase